MQFTILQGEGVIKLRNVNGEGTYTRKASGEEIPYSFVYEVMENPQDKSDVEVLALCNRMLKVDANNVAREKAKAINGDSTARLLTPEEKEQRKAGRKADSELLKAIKSQGLSLEDLKALLK